ncbi:MAG: TolC family protein, partial [Planctomycetota bacterium]
GIAESEFYPRITLSGTVGVRANQFDELFRTGSSFGSVGPSLGWSILNYGRILGNVRLQEARFQQLLERYRQTALLANLEAENAIVAFLKNQERLESQLEAAEAADKTNDLINQLLDEGEADINRVFNVQNFKTQQDESAAVAKGAVAQSLIAIYRALGGGWPSPYLNGPPLPLPPTEESDAEEAEEVAPPVPDEPQPEATPLALPPSIGPADPAVE